MMEITELTNDELVVFLKNGITIKKLKEFFANNNELRKKIRGFRIQTVNERFIIATSINLIRHPNENKLGMILTSYLNDYVATMNAQAEKMISDGYSDTLAKALAYRDGINDEFRPIFNKLQGISDEEQAAFDKALKESDSAEAIIDEKVRMAVDGIAKRLEKTDSNIENVEEKMDVLHGELEKLEKKLASACDSLTRVETKAGSIPEGCVVKEDVERMIKEAIGEADRRMRSSLATMATAVRVAELEKKVAELSSKISTHRSEREKTTIFVEERNIKEYDEVDDFLKDNIGDVIEKMTSGDTFDSFREYLTELIFSTKPIISSKANSAILADVLSSIISGGNYCSLTVDRSTSNDELLKAINSVKKTSGNSVVIIKGVNLGTDYQRLLNVISGRPHTEKFILEIYFDKEIRYLPKEVISECEYFHGGLNKGPIEYRYAYSFQSSARRPFNNGDFSRCLETLGIHREDCMVNTQRYYGIMAFSIIPFLAIHDDEDACDLIAKLPDSEARSKCRAVLND